MSRTAVYTDEDGSMRPAVRDTASIVWVRLAITFEMINGEFIIVPTGVYIDNSKYTFTEITSIDDENLKMFDGELLKYLKERIKILTNKP